MIVFYGIGETSQKSNFFNPMLVSDDDAIGLEDRWGLNEDGHNSLQGMCSMNMLTGSHTFNKDMS